MSLKRRRFWDLRLLLPAVVVWLVSAGTLTWVINGGQVAVIILAVAAALIMAVLVFGKAPQNPEPKHARYPIGSISSWITLTCLAAALALTSSLAHGMTFRDDPIHSACRTKCTIDTSITRNSRLITADGGTWLTHVQVGNSATIQLITPTALKGRVGDGVTLTGRIQPGLSPPALGRMKPSMVKIHPAHSKTARFRARMDAVLDRFDPDIHGLMAGMSIGDFSRMTPQAKTAMNMTGTSHLTAISGTHLAIVMGTIHVLIPGRGRRKVALMSLIIAGLVAVVGPTPSIIRATSMAVIPAWGGFVGRGGQALNSLALVVLVWLLVDPWLAVSAGFTLSSVSTAAVLVVAFGTATSKRPRWKAFAHRAALAFAIPAAASFATAPVLLHMTGKFSTYAILSNVLVLPMVAPATLGALTTALFAQVVPEVAYAIADLTQYPVRWILFVTQKCAGLPLAQLERPGATIATIIVDLLAAIFVAWKVLPLLVAHWIPDEAVASVEHVEGD